jgi:hypothetical protein
MILRTLLVCCFLGISFLTHAQFRLAFGYNYMAAGSWDRAIMTYNFARPDLLNKQPLFIHGIQASGNYMFKSEKTVKHGLLVSYRHFRSAAKNENFKVALNLHLINVGYTLSSRNAIKPGPLSVDVSLSVLCGGIFRKVNGEALIDDDTRVWAPGIGGELRPRICYDLLVKEKFTLSPYLLTTYCPFYYSPRAEALLNQTIGLTGAKYTGILSLEVGICFSFVKNPLQ